MDGSYSEWCPRERTAWIEKFAQVCRHLPFQFVHYCLHPHFAACVFRRFHKLVVYRKDPNKAQVVITIHFTVFKRNVIAEASNLPIFSEYRTVSLWYKVQYALHSVFRKNSSNIYLYGLGLTDGGSGPWKCLYILMTTQAQEKYTLY